MIKTKSNSQYDVCIVGAGVAGCILAANLVRLKYRIIVIEKNLKDRDLIIGELLQPGGIQTLKDMHLDFLLEKIDAQKVKGYTLFLKDENFSIPYGDKIDAGKKEKITALSFKNTKFVKQARKFIKDFDRVDLVEGNVTNLIEKDKLDM